MALNRCKAKRGLFNPVT